MCIRDSAYTELCQKFGLPHKKQYKDYSTGMKMKLCIAVAPVSYTHLDVYKRQLLNLSPK